MSKRNEAVAKLVDKSKFYKLPEALEILKKAPKAKFDESVELHVRLGINPKQSDQIVRGTITLPHGIGKTRKVAVIAKGEKLKEAENAGADITGDADLIEEISKGMLDFDVLVSTPESMKDISKLAKILGPKGLMPNPKSGTITTDLTKTVQELKKGRVEYKNDAYGIIHCSVGKISFDNAKLAENVTSLMEAVIKAKPATSKGQYLKSISLSSTMGPGIALENNF